MYFKLLVVMICALVSVTEEAFEGDFCHTARISKGMCRKIKDCRSAVSDLDEGIRPKLCSFLAHEPVVCCDLQASSSTAPSSNMPKTTPSPRTPANRPAGNKAREKCDEYAGYGPLQVTGEEEQEDTCGRPGIFVVGGKNADPREFPHMAQIGYERQQGGIVWKCGGSLISRRFVLTAAHCAEVDGAPAKWARLGDYNKKSDEDEKIFQAKAVNVAIGELIVHPDYRSPIVHSDIALCRLSSAVTISPFVRPVCLHTGNELTTGQTWATGWGHTEFGGAGSDVLQKVDLYVKEVDECRADYPPDPETLPMGILFDTMMCAGADQRDTCQGDSGGPLHKKNSSVCLYTQVGITSFGKNCGTQSGVYTRVSSFIGWIENIVWPE